MARLYSRKKGKSGSTKPIKKIKPSWVDHDPDVVEQLVLKLAKTQKTSSQIGIILRDTYGLPDIRTITKKKISKILEENKLKPNLPDDLKALIKRDIQVMKHLETHKKDRSAKRGQQLTESKIGRLVSYYKKAGVLPQIWTYDRTKAKTFVE